MYCSNCGHQLDNAKVCPECGTPAPGAISVQQPQQPVYQQPIIVKHRFGCFRAFGITFAVLSAITVFILLITGSCAACMAGLAGAADNAGKNPTIVPVVVTTTKATTTARTNNFEIGDTIEFKNIQLTISKCESKDGTPYDSAPDVTPVWFTIYYKLENLGSDVVILDVQNFKIETESGKMLYFNWAEMGGLPDENGAIPIEKGGFSEGRMTFEVPTNGALTLHYFEYASHDSVITISTRK